MVVVKIKDKEVNPNKKLIKEIKVEIETDIEIEIEIETETGVDNRVEKNVEIVKFHDKKFDRRIVDILAKMINN